MMDRVPPVDREAKQERGRKQKQSSIVRGTIIWSKQ